MTPRVPDVIGIDHVYVTVSDLARSERWYDAVMAVLGFRKRPFAIAGEPHVHDFNRHFGFVIRLAWRDATHDPYAPGLHHLCFRVDSEADVRAVADALHRAGVAASEVRRYPEYADDYFATFLTDPDGVRLEVTNFRAQRRVRHDRWDEAD